MLESIEPVAICDQFVFFLIGELKSEMFGESLGISFYLLVKPLGINSIQFCRITVDQHLLSPNSEDPIFYWHGQPVAICDRFIVVRCRNWRSISFF